MHINGKFYAQLMPGPGLGVPPFLVAVPLPGLLAKHKKRADSAYVQRDPGVVIIAQ